MFILLFFLGSCIASFLNLCAYRIPKNISILFPGSSCERCNAKIEKLYIMPVIGYIISFGKCKKCGSKIPIAYPISEFLFGMMVIAVYAKSGLNFNLIFLHNLLLLSFLYLISVIDLITMEVYTNVIIVFFLMLLITSCLQLCFDEIFISDIYVSLISSFFFFAVFYIFAKLKWFGYGDSFVIFVMVTFLNFNQGILSIILSFIIGGVVGIFVILSKKFSLNKMPFCPFLCIGGIISILFSENIISFYLSKI
ncbi:MAG: prepilin peptidase [Oscillospiraceae bacterium]|nr:prepilin peptidase [Oscillospiraceae bacterium]